MFGFEYKYNTSKDILEGIKQVIDFSPFELAILLGLICVLVITILYIFPIALHVQEKRKQEKTKKKRKKLLTQISMQKEIEDEIAAEIESNHQ